MTTLSEVLPFPLIMYHSHLRVNRSYKLRHVRGVVRKNANASVPIHVIVVFGNAPVVPIRSDEETGFGKEMWGGK